MGISMNTYVIAWTINDSNIKMKKVNALTTDIAVTKALEEDNIVGTPSIYFKTSSEMYKWYLSAGVLINVLKI